MTAQQFALWATAEREAAKVGISPSAWISKAIRDKAIRDFRPTTAPDAAEAAAIDYEAEQAATEAAERRRGKGAA